MLPHAGKGGFSLLNQTYILGRTYPDDDHGEDPGVDEVLDPVTDRVDGEEAGLEVGVQVPAKDSSKLQLQTSERLIANKKSTKIFLMPSARVLLKKMYYWDSRTRSLTKK